MTKEQLLQSLAFLFDGKTITGIEVYFVLKHDEEMQVRFADIEEGLRNDIKLTLLGYLRQRFVENEDVEFGLLTEAENRIDAIYQYDLEDLPSDLRCMDIGTELDRPREFSADLDDLHNLFAFVFVIGNERDKVVIYKKHYPISLIRRDSFLGLVPSDHRFVRLTDDIIKLNETFDFIKVSNETFVLSTKLLERLYGFDGILTREATQRIDLIRGANIIENVELLESLVLDKRAAKMLLRAKRSSHVLSLDFARIRSFIQTHPKLKHRIRFNEANDQIRFHTKTSQFLFLKLLDDDFLRSDLTGSLYDSESKQDLTMDEELDDGG